MTKKKESLKDVLLFVQHLAYGPCLYTSGPLKRLYDCRDPKWNSPGDDCINHWCAACQAKVYTRTIKRAKLMPQPTKAEALRMRRSEDQLRRESRSVVKAIFALRH